MPAAQAVVDAQGPDLEVGEDAVHPRQHDMGGHLADDMGIVADARSAGIGGPSVGFGGSARGKVTGNKGMQAVCRVVGDLAETDAAGAGTAVRDLDGADEEDFALMAATAAAGHGIVLAAADNFGLVDFDEAGERAAARSPVPAARNRA